MKSFEKKVERVLEKKVSRKKFLKLLGIGAVSLPLLSPSVAAQFFIRQSDGSVIDIDDLPSDGGVGGSGSLNQVAVWDGGSSLAGSSGLVWDGSNLGVGAASPSEVLDVDGKVRMRVGTEDSDGDDIVATKGYVDGVAGEGGAVWGDITGTLSDQTDLQSELDGKVEKSGDTMTGGLTLAEGTTSEFSVKLRDGQKLSTPEKGVFEFDGENLFFTVEDDD